MEGGFVLLKRFGTTLETCSGGPMERTMLALMKDLSTMAAKDVQGRGVALGLTSHRRACELEPGACYRCSLFCSLSPKGFRVQAAVHGTGGSH